jgi:hypothetical protein
MPERAEPAREMRAVGEHLEDERPRRFQCFETLRTNPVSAGTSACISAVFLALALWLGIARSSGLQFLEILLHAAERFLQNRA